MARGQEHFEQGEAGLERALEEALRPDAPPGLAERVHRASLPALRASAVRAPREPFEGLLEEALRPAPPQGLTDRVYRATALRIRAASTRRLMWRRSGWAAAAALLLGATVGIWLSWNGDAAGPADGGGLTAGPAPPAVEPWDLAGPLGSADLAFVGGAADPIEAEILAITVELDQVMWTMDRQYGGGDILDFQEATLDEYYFFMDSTFDPF